MQFGKHLANIHLVVFRHKDGWASVLFPSALTIEMVGSWAENFKNKYC